MDWHDLVSAAHAAREHAWAPYSRFSVGAAVADERNRIYSGCNVENSSFGASLCAERTAVAAAITAGARRITAVAVVTDAEPPAAPCGLCRQTLAEFGSADLPIHLVNTNGEHRELRLGELYPDPFRYPTESDT